jgi:hypothetical protein
MKAGMEKSPVESFLFPAGTPARISAHLLDDSGLVVLRKEFT